MITIITTLVFCLIIVILILIVNHQQKKMHELIREKENIQWKQSLDTISRISSERFIPNSSATEIAKADLDQINQLMELLSLNIQKAQTDIAEINGEIAYGDQIAKDARDFNTRGYGARYSASNRVHLKNAEEQLALMNNRFDLACRRKKELEDRNERQDNQVSKL